MKSGRLDAKQEPGTAFDALVGRAQAAGVVTAEEAHAMVAAHELTTKVIRVDDFAQDLGASEMRVASLDALASELGPVSPAPQPSRVKQIARQWG